MDKNIVLTRSGKAGREANTTKEIVRKKTSQFHITGLKGKELSRVLCKILMEDVSPTCTPTPDPICTHVKREINTKLRTYKTNDHSRSLPGESVCDHDVIIQLMVSQKCKCYYCHTEFLVLYKNLRDPLQWSVDRIDNSKAHCESNIVISCLRCNLKRRTRDSQEFYDCRNLTVSRMES
jgi:hypothetical protein